MVMLFSRFRLRRRVAPTDAWMLAPTDTGGPAVESSDAAIAAICAALDDPGYGSAARHAWLARHLPILDGMAGRRFEDHARRFCARSLPFAEGRRSAPIWQVPNISGSLR
jgi:hypothetical protein